MNRHCSFFRRMTLAVSLLAVLTGSALAKSGDSYTMNINITGSVRVNDRCTFNQGGAVNVDFGQVGFKPGGAGNVLDPVPGDKPIASAMTCSGSTAGAQMSLTPAGTTLTATDGHKVLAVSINKAASTSLGIELLVDKKPWDAGRPFPVDMKKPPVLEARLVQPGNGKDFTSGATFTAGATLVMTLN